jgi:hypothetical protein
LNSKRILLITSGLLVIISSLFSLITTHVEATTIALKPTSGAVGSHIALTGDGFIGKLATIFWDDKKLVQNVPVSKDGLINYVFDVPSTTRGTHVLKVTDDSNWTTINASLNFSVTPSITTEPLWGKPGNHITIFGSGFAPSEDGIVAEWDGKDLLRAPLTADRTGSWNTMFDVPNIAKGEYTISAYGAISKAQEVPVVLFTIGPYCTATPLSGPVGTKVTLNGKGFRSGEDGVTFTWDGPIIDTNFTAQPNGTFSWPITVPPSVKGKHTIGIYGSSFTPKHIVPDIEFEVTPSISLSFSSLIGSKDVTVSGYGYNAGESVAITYDKINTGATTTTDDNGSFSITFQAPFSPGKDHTVTATGSKGAVAQQTYTVTMTIPPTPQLLGPGSGAKIQTYNSVVDVIFSIFKNVGGLFESSDSSQKDSVLATLTWKIDGDATGVTYTLQIARTADFSNEVLLKDDIATTSFDLYKSNLLSAGTYYWRVKASGDVGGVSPWSNSWNFDVITASSLVMTLSVAILLLVLAIVAFGVFALINRNKQR